MMIQMWNTRCFIVFLYEVAFLCVNMIVGQSDGCFNIGIIARGSGPIQNSTTPWGHCIYMEWHFVNTDEVFHVFRSVRQLDRRPDIDVILLLNYYPRILSIPHVLETENIDVIVWGAQDFKTEIGELRIIKEDQKEKIICESTKIFKTEVGETNCTTEGNISGDSSFPYESMTVTAPKAIVHMIEILQWTSVVVIFETATVREARTVIDELSSNRVLMIVFNIDEETDFHTTLLKIYKQTVPFERYVDVVMLCRINCARKVFRTVNKFDSLNAGTEYQTLLKKFSHWLVALPIYGTSEGVSRLIQTCADDIDNVVVVVIPEFTGAKPEELTAIVNMLPLERLVDENNESQIHDYKTYFLKKLHEKSLAWGPVEMCKGYSIDTLLWPGIGQRGFSSVGHVDIAGQVELTAELFPNTKFGYNKRPFVVSTLPYYPFVNKKEYANGSSLYEGSVIDLLLELSRVLNFTYTLVEPDDKNWGTLKNDTNLEFNGIIGQLQQKRCDFAAAPLNRDSYRDKVVDFSYPFHFEYTTVITKKPNEQATKWRTFVDLFKWKVLVSIAISLVCVTVLIFLIEKYNPFYDIPAHGDERSRNGGLHYLHNSFWYMYGALLCQGGVHLPDSTAGRTLVSCWWLMCIVVVGIYSGNLIAFLTVTKEKPPFNTLDEMVQMSNYKWGTIGDSTWETTFMTSKLPGYRKIGDTIREFNKTDPGVLHKNFTFHINRVHDGDYAWIGDSTTIDLAMSQECDLIKIKEEFLPLKYAFAFQRNSAHTQIFSKQIMKLLEGGLPSIWKRKWWPKTNFCTSNKKTVSKPISLIDVQSAFYVCVIGMFIGLMSFTIEVIVFRYKAAKQKQEPATSCSSNGHVNGIDNGKQKDRL